ncbi:polybromo-1, putative [Talaromyces stipitatus ATCC 10500]|uniref:Polybromo-1, putative n=1 Tax=Talaromyces stipitatus (strain ATCC 10500 / CBS 375.48 / QM 6759 / NRRL 1006) TaxID=441959 RepID=B8MHL6_TALSN|nr:polybromo-1, putative [Talaromyces stipitatus ATCC 10500]EED15997.1 polybromo-1, putative [Talaromyces stipitatus ATCC 10500]
MSMRRKFTSTGPEPTALPESKRRKVSDDKADEIETPQKTTKVGLKLIDDIKNATDKSGRIIANNFFELPDKKKYPDYYKVIGLPISLNQVIEKLNKYRYANLTELESDLKRLVSNAKKYNEKGTMLFADAERIRKIVTGTMPKINPAYNDPNYTPFPTPIPDQNQTTETPENDAEEDGDNQEQNVEGDVDADAEDAQPSDQALDQGEEEELSFEGDTIQLAQDKIISEMIHLRDDRGREVGAPFLYKPDKNLYKEYYEIIQHPVSLRSLLKQVRGIEGRKPHSKKTAFPTWQLFADEMEYVWGNAREFNEEDSEIVDLVNILEAHFKRRLAEAKSVVPDDPIDETRIKLKLGTSKTPEPRLTLKFVGQKSSSVDDKTSAKASMDRDSVQRQDSVAHRDTPDSSRLGALAQGSPMPGKLISPSPSRTLMPPTAGVGGYMNPSIGGFQQTTTGWPPGPVVPQQRPSYTPVQSLFRKPNEDVSDALIKNLTIKSHPSLGPHPKFCLSIPASPVVRQQSAVVSIPTSQSFLSLSLSILPNTAQRRTKLVALFGPQRAPLAPLPQSTPSELGYDIRLPPGLTKLDFQMVSLRTRGHEAVNGNSHGNGPDKKSFERLTVFFRVVR